MKRYVKRNDHVVPLHLYIDIRHPQIVHTKLRLHISDLKQDHVERHLSNDASCTCGTTSETVEHCLLRCPLYIHALDISILILSPHYITIPILLNSDPNLPSAVNSSIFLTVKKKIHHLLRSGPEHCRLLSLSLSIHTHARAHMYTHACMHAHEHMFVCLLVCLFSKCK